MDKYISYSGWRREYWRGHSDEKNVRAAIRYADRYDRRADLTLFVLDASDERVRATYIEIPRWDWDRLFFGPQAS